MCAVSRRFIVSCAGAQNLLKAAAACLAAALLGRRPLIANIKWPLLWLEYSYFSNSHTATVALDCEVLQRVLKFGSSRASVKAESNGFEHSSVFPVLIRSRDIYMYNPGKSI